MYDFPSLMNAVKPKGRTPLFVVLAGLFALGADRNPVTARQLSTLLAPHLRSKTPPNLNNKLSKYSRYVSRVGSTSPITWILNDRALEYLRSITGLDLDTPNDKPDYLSDIGIICALDHPELSAVVSAFGGKAAWKEIGDGSHAHVYREASIKTVAGNSLRCVATTSTTMGLTAAAIATTQLILQFRPRLVAMIGIAAGTRSGNKQFGDVLVADPSVDYNSGKVVTAGGIREFQPDPYPIGLQPRLRSLLLKYRSAPEIFTTITAGWPGAKPMEANQIHVGPLGASDQVIDDASRVIEIQRNWRKLIGVEMETYGVYRAVHEAPEPRPRAVSFKSVCDFAAEKSDSWQAYAAYVAARFAQVFIAQEWESMWPLAENTERKDNGGK